jgi:hypothetical protein
MKQWPELKWLTSTTTTTTYVLGISVQGVPHGSDNL